MFKKYMYINLLENNYLFIEVRKTKLYNFRVKNKFDYY